MAGEQAAEAGMNGRSPTEILILRHGESEADTVVPKVFEGSYDTPLTPKGVRQARAVAAWLAANRRLSEILSSPLQRASLTAKSIREHLDLSGAGIEVQVACGLRERDNGRLAGLTEEEALKQGLRWGADLLPHETVAGGETLIAFRARAEAWLSAFLARCRPGQRILIVTHGQMIDMLFRCFLGLPMNSSVWFKTDQAGMHCWHVADGRRSVVFANRTEYWVGAPDHQPPQLP